MSESPELSKLKTFLNTLFQFENQDLDFGIYKILNYKREAIKNFIDTLLVDEVKSQLNILEESERNQLEKQLEEFIKDELIKGFIDAKDDNAKEVIKSVSKEKIENYLSLKARFDSHTTTSNAEPVIYNHLTEFFKRYYDKGDFISKRRYSKNEKYVVPYNGEETYFYWANQDQYYIKSSEFFSKYSFKIHIYPNKEYIVNFKLAEAQEESGNVKSESNKYFVLSKKPIEQNKDEINIFFEYRSITDEDKSTLGKNQEELNSNATDKVLKELVKNPSHDELKKTIKNEKNDKDEKSKKKDKSKLKFELDRYTNRNKYDFFIHKDLKGFLSRELDFYIKNELLYLNDLSLFDSETHLEKIRLHLNIIKTFKHIADTIIDFVSQIENFQKKLWEKKKFVINTNYVITLDKLNDFTNKEFTEEILKEVLGNKNQINEWKELFGENLFKEWKSIKLNDLKPDMYSFLKIPIDTKHFSDEFKWKLLMELSKKINIDDSIEGSLFHSDNYQGLNLLLEKYYKSVKCVHIDPPYNTKTSGFLYKNDYKHSSWLSMMNNRLFISLDLLSDKASYLCHIDENEYENLHYLFDKTSLLNAGTIIWDKRNPMNAGFGVAIQHEYIIWRTSDTEPIYIGNNAIISMLSKVSELLKEEGQVSKNVRKKYTDWVNKNTELSGGEKAYKFIDNDGMIYQSVSLRAPEPRTDPKFFQPLIHPITKKACSVPPNGFSRTPETLRKMVKKGEIIFGEDETIQPRQKKYLTEETQRQLTSVIQDAKKGKYDISSLGLNFPYCHPTSLYEKLIGSVTQESDLILDFFPGSATTFHSIQLLNKNDGGKRKSILIEQADYFNTVDIPRIKKVAFSFDWKEGKPENAEGSGIFFKYQKLEQYEDSLENIAFKNSEEVKQLPKYKDYIPKYFLEFETSESKTFLNTEEMKNPFDYKLKVFDNYDYIEQGVDLIETFNYLIGLYVHKYQIESDQKRDYYFVYGKDRKGKSILVIWRDVNKLDFIKDKAFLEKELKKFSYDTLYINSQSAIEGYIQIETVFKNKMN